MIKRNNVLRNGPNRPSQIPTLFISAKFSVIIFSTEQPHPDVVLAPERKTELFVFCVRGQFIQHNRPFFPCITEYELHTNLCREKEGMVA